jgi:hypothetical protein
VRSINEKIRKAIFAKLRELRRKLAAQGIPCLYARSVLSHDDGDNNFKITYQATGNNGDTSLLPQLTIRTGDTIEEFDNANFEQGLIRIRELFRARNEN